MKRPIVHTLQKYLVNRSEYEEAVPQPNGNREPLRTKERKEDSRTVRKGLAALRKLRLLS